MTKARILANTVSTGNVLADGTINTTEIGLGNVENKSSATIRSELTSANVTTALGGVINNIEIGNITPNAGTFTSVTVPVASGNAVISSNTSIASWLYSGKSFFIGTQESAPTGLFIGSAGTKMYVNGSTGDDVNEYTLGTAWNITTATFVTVFSTAAQDTIPVDLVFSPDGFTMMIMGGTTDTVYQYTLSTAWSVATASYSNKSFNVGTQEASPSGLWFKPDGTVMYVVGSVTDAVYQYSLSTAWDVSTASYGGIFYSVAAQDTAPTQVNLSNDGLKMWLLGSAGDDIWEYNLDTAWNISTATPVNNVYIGFQDVTPNGLFIDSTASNRVYMVGSTTDSVFQYNTATNSAQFSTDKLYTPGALSVNGNFVAGENAYVDGTLTVQGAATLGTTTLGSITITGSINASTNTSNISLGTAQTTGVWAAGGTSQTGAITLGQSTVSQTTNIQAGATASGSTKTINFGTGGLTGSTTTIAIGSTFGTAVTANGTWTYSTPIVGSVTGSAATLTTPRTIAITGDVTYTSGSFNGSTDVTGVATLANSGVTAGTYTKVTTDAKGRVTSGTTLAAGDIPTLNQNTTGTAANVTGTVAIANGGTGATTRQAAMDALAGAVTAGQYLRGDGNDVVMSAIQAADVPTLNQNTTGSAATLTTGRTIALTGDVAYTSGSFNGSANVTGTATLASVGTAGTYTKVTTDAKGRVTSGTTLAASDIPALDASKITSGVIDAARLPSYVDDVVEAANLAGFPATGETGKIYVALDTNKVYRWSGSAYIYITSGAVDSVAGRTGVVTLTKTDVGLANVDNTTDAAKPVSSAQQTALNLKANLASPTFTGTVSGITATMVGLGSVENKSSATIRSEITSANVTTALGFTPYNSTNPNGYITSSGSISGNAATATSASLIDNVEFRNGDSSSGINPDSISVNGTGYITSVNLLGQTDGALYSQAYSTSWVHQIFGDYRTGQLAVRGRNSGSLTAWRTVLDSSNYAGFAMPIGSSATNSVDVRAPIFYDSQDTNYYIDPNSGSRLLHIFAGNVASSNDGGWNARMNLVGSSHARLDVVSNSDGIITTMYSHTGQGVGRVGTYSNHPLILMAQGAAEGGSVYSGSLRSPIFYDSNDTNYYIDPRSDSRLHGRLTVDGDHGDSSLRVALNAGSNGAATGIVTLQMWCSEPGITWDSAGFGYNVTNDGGGAYGFSRTNSSFGQAYMRFTPSGTLHYYNTNTSGTRYETLSFSSIGNVTVHQGLYTPITYDSNNTAFYVDPASTTNLNVLFVGGQQVTGGGGSSYATTLKFQ